MTPADFTLALFTLCNGLRVLAYGPQIAKAATDLSGAAAISFSTWGLFLFSNLSAVAYALVNKEDWTMATMFLGNAVGCAAILLIGAWRRSQHRHRLVERDSVTRSQTNPRAGFGFNADVPEDGARSRTRGRAIGIASPIAHQ